MLLFEIKKHGIEEALRDAPAVFRNQWIKDTVFRTILAIGKEEIEID